MLCVSEFNLPELKIKPESPEEAKIGQFIAENLVEDGATLQMGKCQIENEHILNQADIHVSAILYTIVIFVFNLFTKLGRVTAL